MSRLVIAALFAAWACRARVAVAPGISAPLPAVLLAVAGIAAVAASVACVRIVRRDGWQLCPFPHEARPARWRA